MNENLNSEVLSNTLIADYYRNHLYGLRAYVRKCVHCEDDAEDIVQNVFLRLLTSERMISEITLPCLVYTVARNLITDYNRHFQIADHYEHLIAYQNMHNEYDAESIYSANEIIRLLERGTACLPERNRRIYMMNVYEGMKTSEISEALDENYKSIENCLGAARKQVRKYMRRMLSEVI